MDAAALPPIVLCRRRRRLVPDTLESTLLQQPRPFVRTGWSEEAHSRGLFFDLSFVEWFEMGALVQLCLLVESARREEIDATVSLPLTRARRSEAHLLQAGSSLPKDPQSGIKRRIARRGVVRDYLTYIGFEQALNPMHLREAAGSLTILDEFDISTVENEPQVEEIKELPIDDLPSMEGAARVAFPLRWMARGDPAMHECSEYLSQVVGSPRGINPLAAKTVSNVVLEELIDNAVRHGGSPRALVAAWARPRSVTLRTEDYLEADRDFVEWLRHQADCTRVELVIGDSGHGIPAVLGPRYRGLGEGVHAPVWGDREDDEVLAWAFERDSTSDPEKAGRGTRGLYRVDRVVKKYAGLGSIRAARSYVGWDHGGASFDQLTRSSGRELASVPGTVVRIQLPVIKHVLPPRPPPATAAPSDLSFRLQRLEAEDGSLTAESAERLRIALTANGRGPSCSVIVLPPDLSDSELSLGVLRQAAESRDPAKLAVAVVDPEGWTVLDNARISLDKEVWDHRLDLEWERRRHYRICDPLLLLGNPTGESGALRGDLMEPEGLWAGAPPAVTRILNSLAVAEGSWMSWERFRELVAPDDVDEVRRALRHDTTLVTLDDRGLRLRLHPKAIFDHVAERVQATVEAKVETASPDAVTVAPSLIEVGCWFKPAELIPADVGDPLAVLALAHRVREQVLATDACFDSAVADPVADVRRLRRLRGLLDVRKEGRMPAEDVGDAPEDLRVVSAGERVLVYADIIGSGASLHRVITQVLRDGATPAAVVCVLDARDRPGEPILAWGLEVPAVSLASRPLRVEDGKARKQRTYMSPQGGRVEPERPERIEPKYEISPEDLPRLASDSKAIHFGHTGSHGGLHFTFYVDSKNLLKKGSQLQRAAERVIANWGEEVGAETGGVNLWYPRPEPKVESPAWHLAQALVISQDNIARAEPIGREEGRGSWNVLEAEAPEVEGRDVAIVDWGSLKGNTLMGMLRLAANSGARNILACVCLNQLPAEMEHLLTSLEVVQGSRLVERRAGQQKLEVESEVEVEDSGPGRESVPVPTQVKFLSSLPVPAFTPRECPVCQQLDRISREQLPTRNLEAFAEEQVERLALRERRKTISQPPTDVDGEPLSGDQAVRMLDYRAGLEESLRSTRRRERLLEELEELAESDQAERLDEIADLMRFLAIELQWLRRPPLSFDRAKRLLTEVAAELAMHEEAKGGDRVNALVVLRSCSRELFAKKAADVYAAVCRDATLVRQLLYGVHTYLESRYLNAPAMLDLMVEALEGMNRCLEERQGEGEVEAAEDLWQLTNRARFLKSRAERQGESEVDTWNTLKQELAAALAKHEPAWNALSFLDGRSFAHLAEERFEPARNYWTSNLISWWEEIETLLADTVVPALGRLEGIFRDSAVVGNTLGRFRAPLIERIDTPVQDWRIAQLVRELSGGIRPMTDPIAWREYEEESAFLVDGLLSVGEEENAGGSSRLVRALGMMPTPLTATVDRAAKVAAGLPLIEQPDLAGLPANGVSVFYPEGALWTMVRDLLANIEKHHAAHHSTDAEGAKPARVWFSAEVSEGTVALEVRNTDTVPRSPAGKGSRELKRELHAFGGELKTFEGRDLAGDPDATYKVRVEFKRGDPR